MRHIISATTLSSGAQLAMCGHVFGSFDAAVSGGHRVGNYFRPASLTLSGYHAEGVDCEACIIKHAETCKRYA